MEESIFPVRPREHLLPNTVLSVEPYWHEGAWVFDDAVVGLAKEPFVAGVTEMIDRLAAHIPDAAKGFRLRFSATPFAGMQTSLTWLRADPVEGNWYQADDVGDEGWLCPALFWYFSSAPKKIYLQAEPK
jgi:hypothetical protein